MFRNGQTVEEVFGKSPEDIKKDLEAGREAAAKLADIQNGQKTTNDALDGIKNTLAALEGRLTTAAAHKEEVEEVASVIPSVSENEEGAFAARLAPIANLTLETKAELVLNRISKKFGDWNKFEKEITDILANTPLNLRCNPAAVENAYFIARGRKVEDIVRDNVQGSGEFFVEPTSGQTNNGTNVQKTDVELLTDKDKEMANKYGISLEQWAASKKDASYV